MELKELCDRISEEAADITEQVLHRWGEIAESEPWLALPADLDFDHLPALIRRMAVASLCTTFDRGACRDMLAAAATHGEHRARQGFDESLIYREYHLLRRALWARMKSDHGESANVYYASIRMDAISTLATAGALHGMHRTELEEQGRWPAVLEEIMTEWSLPVA
ncbi:MAG TPA: RsbRD N-terminal domain-containing protein [Longimicrobiales bacterium]|nr:RsbRD N-terminal domain-containing protein [Longimicrobiales bacterium]